MSDCFTDLRANDFSRLDRGGHVYLDYTGAGLYAEGQVRAHADYLCEAVLGNPHSRNPSSQASTDMVEAARLRVLEFFGADRELYEVIFTLNASGALKLVAEAYPWEPGGSFVMLSDNHNSVNGMREYAQAGGAEVRYVPLNDELRVDRIEEHLVGAERSRHHLFAYPAQSNFSGVKHPLEWIDRARDLGYHTLLDAAAFVPTSRLNLEEHKPDFAVLSFYKMFGFPTGVGALIARRNVLGELHRPWFSGGTVRFVSAQNRLHLSHVTGRAFEDGTPNYLGIAAVRAGLDFLADIGIERINAHVMCLTESMLEGLKGLRHENGAPMIRIYGPQDTVGRGGSVAFNLLDPAGELVDFREVERRTNEANVSIRTGFFCNPGAAEFAFEYRGEDAFHCIKTLTPETFTLQQFSDCMSDHAVGAVRASVGIGSNQADLERLFEVLAGFRDQAAAPAASAHAAAITTAD